MRRILSALFASTLAVPATAQPQPATGEERKHDAIVSGAWLEQQSHREDLVVLDVRAAADYAAGHIPGSVSIPFDAMASAWSVMRNDLIMELPETEDLFALLGSHGITRNSLVVLVTAVGGPGEPPFLLAAATRVAVILSYLGVRGLAVLDGGYPRWQAEGRVTTTEMTVVTPGTYDGPVNESLFVDTGYVSSRIGGSVIIDARDAAVYHGEVTEPWAGKPGHIPSAVSLPSPLMWNEDGTYRNRSELADLVTAAVGPHSRSDEIIVYCGVGGYASSWTYVLTHVLGYRNVRMYDGSAQEWVREHDMQR
jgi:thiosulfate/3-mercaptopyruvate sulfurtransferase